ncbi:hypothetical protein BDQ17DRAFT_1427367 [Cyathus striatus]|nr:hypothetical protein BDQ17DRAFT_1427367 [Cyathus striatus]
MFALCTGAFICNIITTTGVLRNDDIKPENKELETAYFGDWNIICFLVNWSSSVLLAWRCIVLYSEGSLDTSMTRWIVPFVTGFVLFALGGMGTSVYILHSLYGQTVDLLFLIYMGISFLVNIIFTSMIIGRLAYFRRAIALSSGWHGSVNYTQIMSMLVESAAIIILFDVFFTLTFFLHPYTYGSLGIHICVQVQNIGSVLIIFRVFRGYANQDRNSCYSRGEDDKVSNRDS